MKAKSLLQIGALMVAILIAACNSGTTEADKEEEEAMPENGVEEMMDEQDAPERTPAGDPVEVREDDVRRDVIDRGTAVEEDKERRGAQMEGAEVEATDSRRGVIDRGTDVEAKEEDKPARR